jgi:hypothetical protein
LYIEADWELVLAGGKNALRGICGTKHPPEIFTGRRRNK